MNFICLNKNFIKQKTKSVLAVEMSIISFSLTVFSFFGDFTLKNWNFCLLGKFSVVFLFFIFCVFIAFILSCLLTFLKVENRVWGKNNSTLSIIYGDIFNLKQKKNKKQFIVIPVDTQFMTEVDSESLNIKYPRVAPDSLHGKFISKFYKNKNDKLKNDIETYIDKKEYKIDKKQQSKYSTLSENRFEVGTIVQIAPENDKGKIFLLLALAEFDEHNKASCSKSKLIIALNALFKFYDENCQGGDLYIPLMGTGFSRVGLTENESLRITKSCAELNLDYIKGNVSIVVYKKLRMDVSIFQ
ncbi:macro domain-containing protein [Treponema sp. UBA753]|uniref:macro domain-containing protein n=1 Tax=Treponema sp. UBA753 TaxID=1947747 RepID=UPI0025E8406E|nr:macro domain-containing protein [Treponema sp. UBA753]